MASSKKDRDFEDLRKEYEVFLSRLKELEKEQRELLVEYSNKLREMRLKKIRSKL